MSKTVINGKEYEYLGVGFATVNTSASIYPYLVLGSRFVHKRGVTSYDIIKGNNRFVLGGVPYQSRYYGYEAVYSGGKALNATVSSGGRLETWDKGLISTASIYSNGRIIVSDGGKATKVNIYSGGRAYISSGGSASSVAIFLHGQAIINNGGIASNINVQKNGILQTGNGAIVSSFILSSGAKLKMNGICSMGGTIKMLSGAQISTSGSGVLAFLGQNTNIILNKNINLGSVYFAMDKAKFVINYNNNNIYKLEDTGFSNYTLNISNISSKDTKVMLNSRRKSELYGAFTIVTKVNQHLGSYKLLSNIEIYSEKSFAIQQGISNIGKAEINGDAISKNGLKYKISKVGKQIKLSISAIFGRMVTGLSRSNSLVGTSNCDIFYGTKGNDIIDGKNGRDVIVYDKNNWGNDVISRTQGTMTIVFNGIKSSDIKINKKGTSLIVERKGYSKQAITVRNWKTSTHSIVYGGVMTQFSNFVKSASPSAALKQKAKTEVWKKAGILA